MATKTKKVILFIVEGPTDEDALSPVLKRYFQSEDVRFHVVHGDITTDFETTITKARNVVHDHIKKEMSRYGFRKGDILKVIHLIDTDGAFIPDACVISGDVEKICYSENQIISKDRQMVIGRNQKKTQVLQRLYPAYALGGLPYFVYYFSRNLEHVLHNISENLSDDEKIDYADRFADTYHSNPDAFINFLSNSVFTVPGDYVGSWKFIFRELNSLHRYCNLHLLFREV